MDFSTDFAMLVSQDGAAHPIASSLFVHIYRLGDSELALLCRALFGRGLT
jgi:hypothetical protein